MNETTQVSGESGQAGAGAARGAGSRRHLGRALTSAAVVVVAAPPAGSLVLSAFFAAASMADGVQRAMIIENPQQALAGGISLTFFLAAFSYVYGIVPAALSCLWLGWRIYQQGTVSMSEAILTSVAAALLFAVVFSLIAQDFPGGILSAFVMLVVPAVFSAFVCRRLLGAVGILPAHVPAVGLP